MINKHKVLIIGKTPSPIGGVTIHVSRLVNHFYNDNNIQIEFIDFNKTSLNQFLIKIIKYKKIHLHTSNVFFRLLFSIFCFFLFKKLIVTIHNDLGRYGLFKNIVEYLSIFISRIPIVLNKKSFLISKKINRNTLLITSFLPPVEIIKLDKDLLNEIDLIKKKYDLIFCTNAFKFNLNRKGDEIYGILNLIDIFNKIKNKFLIISDPSGTYNDFFIKNKILISDNIKLIPYDHDFFEILKNSDVFIRNTITDGDSISVKEALYLNKTVFATDVVSRPKECTLYSKDDMDFLEKIIREYKINRNNFSVESCYFQLSNLYSKL